MSHNSFIWACAAVAGLAALPICAETLCSGESAQVRLDLVTGPRIATGTERLTHSTEWYGGDSVRLAADGTTLAGAEALAGEGAYDWTPDKTGIFVLTHTVVTNGVPVELTATFKVPVQVGDEAWAFVEDGTCTVFGTGDMWSYAKAGTSALWNCRGDIAQVVIQDGVTGVGTNFFANMRGIRDVAIGDSVTNVDAHAFSMCLLVTNVVLGAGVESVGRQAFASCNALQAITVGSPDIIGFSDSFRVNARITMDGENPIIDAVPVVTIAGWDRVLEGCEALGGGWEVIPDPTDIPVKYHFFRWKYEQTAR